MENSTVNIIANKIMTLMNDIQYGYLDKDNIKHLYIDDFFSSMYKLQSPFEILENKIGVCWDQVELQRYYFEKENILCKTYFIVYYDNDKCPTHTFLVYKNNDFYYWFEHSWEKYRGIHKYSSLDELLTNVRKRFIKEELPSNFNNKNLCLYDYKKPNYGISCMEFYKHCEMSTNINVE